jgi:signal transduction histidine kinase
LIGASGRLEGVLNLENPRPNAFTERDSHQLQALATQAVIAIQEVLMMDAVKEVTELLLSQSEAQVLQRLAELASELLNAAASAIWVAKDGMLVVQASSGDFSGGESVPIENSLVGSAVLTHAPVVAEDVRTDPRFNRRDLAQARGWARALVVPLPSGDDHDLAGAMSVFGLESEPGHFAESDWDKKVLTILADYAALAMLNDARQAALQQAREQRSVAETFAALGDAAANLLHQMNNRIGVIPVRVQGIQDKCQDALRSDPYLETNLAQIEQGAREAMSIVRDNLELLRPISLGRVDVADCVAQAIAAARLPDGVHVELEGLPDLPLVVAASQSLTLVFTNLLENAANAMKGSGAVTIHGTALEDSVRIDVRDTGPGISPQVLDQIFEFNFSGDQSAHGGKLGFGLWWIKTLMMRLGGSVAVESDGEHGTTFQLRLPFHEESGERSKEIAT